MTAVADSSPLILLGKVRRLDLLHMLYGDVVLAPAVVDEVLAKPEAIGPDLRAFVMAATVRPVQNVALVSNIALYPSTRSSRASGQRSRGAERRTGVSQICWSSRIWAEPKRRKRLSALLQDFEDILQCQ